MFSNPTMVEWEWVAVGGIFFLTVGLMIAVSTLIGLGIIKLMGSDEKPSEKKVDVVTPTLPHKGRTAA